MTKLEREQTITWVTFGVSVLSLVGMYKYVNPLLAFLVAIFYLLMDAFRESKMLVLVHALEDRVTQIQEALTSYLRDLLPVLNELQSMPKEEDKHDETR